MELCGPEWGYRGIDAYSPPCFLNSSPTSCCNAIPAAKPKQNWLSNSMENVRTYPCNVHCCSDSGVYKAAFFKMEDCKSTISVPGDVTKM